MFNALIKYIWQPSTSVDQLRARKNKNEHSRRESLPKKHFVLEKQQLHQRIT